MGTRKILMGGVVAGSVGLGGLIGALVFAPGVGFAGSDTNGGGRELGLCLGAAGPLDAAAEAIGIGTTELVSALRDGDSIADVARAHDVPVSEVVDAVVASMQARLDAAVEDGALTRRQADALSGDLEEKASDLVNGRPAVFPDVPHVTHVNASEVSVF
jgi:hypothetical protein